MAAISSAKTRAAMRCASRSAPAEMPGTSEAMAPRLAKAAWLNRWMRDSAASSAGSAGQLEPLPQPGEAREVRPRLTGRRSEAVGPGGDARGKRREFRDARNVDAVAGAGSEIRRGGGAGAQLQPDLPPSRAARRTGVPRWMWKPGCRSARWIDSCGGGACRSCV